MIDRQLELILKQKLAERDVQVRVINLAMAGSLTYQNVVACNLWGQALAPDLVVSFSGGNDIANTQASQGNAQHLEPFGAYPYVPIHAKRPAWLRGLESIYPGWLRHTSLGYRLLGLSQADFLQASRERYARAHDVEWLYNRRHEFLRLASGDHDPEDEARAREAYRGPDVFRKKVIGRLDPKNRPTVLEHVSRKPSTSTPSRRSSATSAASPSCCSPSSRSTGARCSPACRSSTMSCGLSLRAGT